MHAYNLNIWKLNSFEKLKSKIIWIYNVIKKCKANVCAELVKVTWFLTGGSMEMNRAETEALWQYWCGTKYFCIISSKYFLNVCIL